MTANPQESEKQKQGMQKEYNREWAGWGIKISRKQRLTTKKYKDRKMGKQTRNTKFESEREKNKQRELRKRKKKN